MKFFYEKILNIIVIRDSAKDNKVTKCYNNYYKQLNLTTSLNVMLKWA